MKKKAKNPLKHRRHIWPWVLVSTLLTIIIYALLRYAYSFDPSAEILVATLGGIFGTAFFVHRGHAENARFSKELMTEFNSRYDDINDRLRPLMNTPSDIPLSEDEEITIVDYFNLCAEEWLFFKAGYIWDPVWESWLNGMKQYAASECFIQMWAKERTTDSYYGFEFPIGPQTIR